jgi:PrtD family type I secretion system ABC transporter
MKNSPQLSRPRFLRSFLAAFLGVALLSGLINVLYLSGSVYMIEVYDRVLASRSIPTLVGLSGILGLLYLFQGLFDVIRSRILGRIGNAVGEELGEATLRLCLSGAARSSGPTAGHQSIRDLDVVRNFLAGSGPGALFDLPWIPIYLLAAYAFHPWIGAAALCGALVLVSLTALTEILTRAGALRTASAAGLRHEIADSGLRNAEAVHAMGMAGAIVGRWGRANQIYLGLQQASSDMSGGFASASKILRTALQSAVLAVGACLVIEGQATGGIMIASSVLVSRALAPVELAIANWKGFVASRQACRRLRALLETEAAPSSISLPSPRRSLDVEYVSSGVPGTRRWLVQDVSFSLKAGSGLGIVGASASGKSSLVRTIVGVWPTWRGTVRIDGAALEQWDAERLGRHIGYLPQDVELFSGTVAESIARHSRDIDSDLVLAAARAADVHEMILRLPDGYDTQIGSGGAALSAGQRQRIALARALYGDPFLVVLDEPNSNLDAEGEQALTRAILGVRARGGIVIVVAHRPSALAGVDKVLVMAGGSVQGYGPKDEILNGARPRTVREAGATPLRAAIS